MRILQKAGYRAAATFVALGALGCAGALADGIPEPGQIGFDEAVTPIAHEIHFFHNVIIMPIITLISLFVAVLLAIVVRKFNAQANPTPSKTTHNTVLEVAWTLIPVLILFSIFIPSMKLLTNELVVPKSDMTIKVTGKQWFWSYEYPDNGLSFNSLLVREPNGPGYIRQLTVDKQVVVPVNKTVHLLVKGDDVIHSFVVQSFGVRVDAVPGRMNESWFKAEKEGVYYGQCSKLCGKDHAYMPISFKVVSEAAYKDWLAAEKKDEASAEPVTTTKVRFAGAQQIETR